VLNISINSASAACSRKSSSLASSSRLSNSQSPCVVVHPPANSSPKKGEDRSNKEKKVGVVPCIDIKKIVIWDTTNLMQTVFGGGTWNLDLVNCKNVTTRAPTFL
jgi:hypothetical protein